MALQLPRGALLPSLLLVLLMVFFMKQDGRVKKKQSTRQ